MKEKLLVDFISELLSVNKLQDNNVADILTQYCTKIDLSTRENCYEDILKYYFLSKKNKKSYNIKVNEVKNITKEIDYRIKQIKVKNIKSLTESEDNQPYGISFSTDNSPSSCIIYGTNGIGKSAIFGTLEYVFANKVSEYNARHINESSKDYLSFLSHNSISGNAFCEIDTVDKKLFITDNGFLGEDIFFAENCFINDATVTKNGVVDYDSYNDYSAHILIANGMGLKYLTDIATVFGKMSVYNRQKEKREHLVASNATKQSRELLSQWNERILSIHAQLSNLKQTENSSVVNVENIKISTLLDNLRTHKINFPENINSLEDRIRDFLVAYQQLRELENLKSFEHRYGLINHAKHILNATSQENCPLCNSYIDTTQLSLELDLELNGYQDQIAQKDAAKINMGMCYDQLEHLIDLYVALEKNINDAILQLAGYSIFSECIKVLKQLSDLVKNFKTNDYINTIISIKTSGDSAEQLNRFLYYELENLITVNNQMAQQINDLLKNFYQKLEDIVAYSDFAVQLNVAKQVSMLEQELDYLTTQVSNERIHLTNLTQVENQTKEKLDLQVSVTEEIKSINPHIQKIVNKKVIETFAPIKATIETIMEQFLEDDNCKLDIHFDNDYICFHIITSDGIRIVPSIYFNTFRYKLFCTALSFAIALLMRKKTAINLPLVFDDPFTGFDTTNREQMLVFIRKMTEIAQTFSSSDKPIQVITFTHNWQLFQILRSALQTLPNTRFMIMDHHRLAHPNETYYELTRKV